MRASFGSNGRPAFIVNTYGKGKAVLLNMFLNHYPRRQGLWAHQGLLQIAAAAFAATNTTPRIATTVTGDHTVKVRRFVSGDVQLVGLLRDVKPGGCSVRLTLPAAPHVYDAREGTRGLKMVYEPKYLRFFQARFERLG